MSLPVGQKKRASTPSVQSVLLLAPQIGLELGEHTQHVQEGTSRRPIGFTQA
jgi:hypothetical protein